MTADASRPPALVRAIVRSAAALAIVLLAADAARAQFASCGRWVSENGYPGVNGIARALASYDDGTGRKLVIGGEFTRAHDVDADNVVLCDGDAFYPLQSAGNRINGPVNAFANFDDGSGSALYAAGLFSVADGSPADYIARWDGARWVDVGFGMNGEVNDLAVFDDGTGPALYAAGAFVSAGGVTCRRVARWDGSAWSPLGNGMYESLPGTLVRVSALEAFDDGSGRALYAAGAFVNAGTVVANSIARWDGAAWSAVGSGLNKPAHATAVFESAGAPALVVGGEFTEAGGVAASHVAFWDGMSWLPTASGTSDTVRSLTAYDFGAGRVLYAGGDFFFVGSTQANHVARWDGQSWAPLLGGGVGRPVLALRGIDLGKGPRLFVGGEFTSAAHVSGGVSAWTGSGFEMLAPGTLSSAPRVIATHDDGGAGDAIYVADGPTGVLRNEGGAWVTFGDGVNGRVETLRSLDDGTGSALYVGGAFTSAGSTPASRIAVWRDGGWTNIGAGLPSSVFEIAVFDDGSGGALYALGAFDGTLARWDGAAWIPASGGRATTPFCMAGFDDGSGYAIYVGGSFRRIGGAPIRYLARWDGSAWSPVGDVARDVEALTVFDDGAGAALYGAGSFPGGTSVARWNGAAWTSVGSGPGFGVTSLVTLEVGGRSILVAGGRPWVSGAPLAYWDGSDWTPFGDDYSTYVTELATFPSGSPGSGKVLVVGGADLNRIVARWQDDGGGTVNAGAGAGRVTDVLFVNDAAGGAGRTVEVSASAPLTVFLAAAPAGGGRSPFALYAWDQAPTGAERRFLPKGLGATCLPTPLSGGDAPRPIAIWNNTGKAIPGAATHPSSAAPAIVAFARNGIRRAGTYYLQGLIADPASAGDRPASVTNGVTIISR